MAADTSCLLRPHEPHEAVDQFTGGLAHDVTTDCAVFRWEHWPLCGILTVLNLEVWYCLC